MLRRYWVCCVYVTHVIDSDSIEAHVTVAHDHVEDGREELIKAATYQACGTFLPANIAVLHHK